MIIANSLGIAGRYKLEAVNVWNGERRLLADWFDNLITDPGLNNLPNGTVGDRCFVGSGNAVPSVNDSALQTLVATSNSSIQAVSQTAQTSTPPYYHSAIVTYRFAQGAAAGNLSEIGIGKVGASWIFSRSLIKDASGNPTTVTVLPSEFLDVSYELRSYVPMNDATFTRTISGTNYNVLMRSANAGGNNLWGPYWALLNGSGFMSSSIAIEAYSGAIGANVLSTPSSTISGSLRSGNWAAYVNNSLKRSCSFTLGLNDDNHANGIRSILLATNGVHSAGAYQFEFTPSIPKTASNILTLNFEVSWARRP